MEKETRMKLEKLFDVLGELIAFFAVVIFAALIINATFNFLPETVLNIFKVCQTFAGLALIGVVGLEAVIKRCFLIRIIFYILLAICIIFMFFPGTWDNLIDIVQKVK